MGVSPVSKESLEKIRQKLRKTGRLLALLCRIQIIFPISGIVLMVFGIISAAINKQVPSFITEVSQSSTFYKLVYHMASLSTLDPMYQAMIGCFSFILVLIVVLVYLNMFENMMNYLATGGQPFTLENAKKMRNRSWLALLLCFNNLSLGLLSFVLVILFSYLMEYGSYLQLQADETNRIQEEMIFSFAEITENKSGQTGKHIRRVSEYSKIIARQLGKDEEFCEKLRVASIMHDVGKLMIPSEILEKPGKLTDEEYGVIKTHTTWGGKLLDHVEGDEMRLARTVALEHHERYDGKGYPSGLSKEDISEAGRIVAVADVYDALTSRRSYKEKWDDRKAYDEIMKGRGTQFDPQVTDAFASAYEKIQEAQRKFADQA